MVAGAIDLALPIDPTATLVVTRPMPEARRLVDILEARGRKVVALPVLAIEAVDDDASLLATMARIDDYRLVTFVSPNAIRRALAHRASPWPTSTAIGVMGPGSVETLHDFGIAGPGRTIVVPASKEGGERFDSEALFDALDDALGLTHGFAGRVLILRGNGGRGWLADRLRALGIAVDEVEAYRRTRPVADTDASRALLRLVAARDPAVFIVTSSEGVANLPPIVEQALAGAIDGGATAARAWLFDQLVLAPHRRIVEKARQAGFSRVSLCAPGDRGILAAIE